MNIIVKTASGHIIVRPDTTWEKDNCRLLTGDKTLKDKATLENVKVSGILFLTDMLTRESIVDGEDMIMALEHLLSSNNRLPKKLIKERIETLKRMTTL